MRYGILNKKNGHFVCDFDPDFSRIGYDEAEDKAVRFHACSGAFWAIRSMGLTEHVVVVLDA